MKDAENTPDDIIIANNMNKCNDLIHLSKSVLSETLDAPTCCLHFTFRLKGIN